MIVVDSNILAYLYLPGEFTASAEKLLQTQPQWAAPFLWQSEFRNILAGYLRRSMLSFEQACMIQSHAQQMLQGREYLVASREVLALVQASDCSAYDCEFIALAQQLGTHLVTMDKKLLKAFPRVARALV